MIPIPARRNQHLAVFGLSASGLATARALAASGVTVSAWDDNADKRDAAAAEGIGIADLSAASWKDIDALVLSPGVPLTHPEPHWTAQLANDAGRPIIGDIELLAEARTEATFVGITGTNGKSTTTSLIGHVLQSVGREVAIGGNLGPPALTLEPLDEDGVYVLELSSYQLDLTHEARFDVAVLLNLTPDHLDRHGDMEGYLAAKRRIFRDRPEGSGRPAQVAVVGIDDAYGRRVQADMAGNPRWRVVPVSSAGTAEGGVYVLDGLLYDATEGAPGDPVCDLSNAPALPGAHNWQNAAAAYAAARALGIGRDAICAALATFPGLPHRQELVATIGGVRYVNDSKATNGEAAAKAIACYDGIYLIAGGLAKEGGLDVILPLTGRIRHVFLIGEAAEPFAAELDGKAAVTQAGDLATAVGLAHRAAQSAAQSAAQAGGEEDAVVLLSPACASFDQWPNFEARGNAFRTLVRELAGEASP